MKKSEWIFLKCLDRGGMFEYTTRDGSVIPDSTVYYEDKNYYYTKEEFDKYIYKDPSLAYRILEPIKKSLNEHAQKALEVFLNQLSNRISENITKEKISKYFECECGAEGRDMEGYE